MTSPETLRDALRAWATGVAVVSAQHNDFRHGMTVNSFTSISLDPPLIAVSIEHYLRTMKLIEQSGAFAVSILRDTHAAWSDRFAGRETENTDRFLDIATRAEITGSPILVDALAYFDCRVETSFPGGTHTIVLGRVLAAGRAEGKPLIYWNRNYRHLG